VEQALWVLDTSESALLPLMESVIGAHPDTRLYSLPHIAPDGRQHIELGLRGEAAAVGAAMAHLRAGLSEAGVTCHDALPPDRRHDAAG
jgi:molybdopterin-biosynthesis enzyme MoeA-like protein